MAKKSEEAAPDDRGQHSVIEARQKAKQEATTQEGETPPENQDVNEAPVNPKASE